MVIIARRDINHREIKPSLSASNSYRNQRWRHPRIEDNFIVAVHSTYEEKALLENENNIAFTSRTFKFKTIYFTRKINA